MGAYRIAPTIGAITKSLYTPAYKELLRLLREEREEVGLSQRALAERLREHHSWVAKVELGERRLDLLEFVRVCRALDLDPVRAFRKFLKRAGL